MQLSPPVRITLIVVGGVVALGLAGLSVLSGAELDFAEILKAVAAGAGGVVTGLGLAGGPSKS